MKEFLLNPLSSEVLYKEINRKDCIQIRLNMNGGASGVILDIYCDYNNLHIAQLSKPCLITDIFGNTIQVHPNYIAYARKVQVIKVEKTILRWNGKYLDQCEYYTDGAKIVIEHYVIGENDTCLVTNNDNSSNLERPNLIKELEC